MKSLVGTADLTAEELHGLLDAAERWRDADNRVSTEPPLKGRVVANLFMEASTRTRFSFETAAKRLGAEVLNFSASGTSVEKGETLSDTLKTIDAMHPDVIVLRHRASGAAMYAVGRVRCPVINAGDGRHEHPTQGLLDALSVRRAKGKIEGLEIAIVGDVLHSRVARSAIHVFTKLGARVRLGGPRSLVPDAFEALGAVVAHSVRDAVEGADVVMALRVQKERMGESFFPNNREYARWFGLSPSVLQSAKDDVLVMHPGPMNRGVEISSAVADQFGVQIQEQVTNGVAVRMAVLERAVAS